MISACYRVIVRSIGNHTWRMPSRVARKQTVFYLLLCKYWSSIWCTWLFWVERDMQRPSTFQNKDVFIPKDRLDSGRPAQGKCAHNSSLSGREEALLMAMTPPLRLPQCQWHKSYINIAYQSWYNKQKIWIILYLAKKVILLIKGFYKRNPLGLSGFTTKCIMLSSTK